MTGRITRLAGVAATGIVLVAATVAFAPASAARAASGCTSTNGVVLGVDFGHWGGPVVSGCDTSPANGLALLNEGGFHSAGTRHDGPAFVCRIASDSFHGQPGYPTPAQDKCQNTPPASAYWSYWHADAGQNFWSYSKLGAASTHPKAGSVDFWRFGDTNVSGTTGAPQVSPNQVRAHYPSKTSSGGGHGSGTGSGSGSGRDRTTSHAAGHGSSGGDAGSRRPRGGSASGTVQSGTRGSSAPASHTSSTSASPSSSGHPTGASTSSTSATAGSAGAAGSSSAPRIINGSPAAHNAAASSSGGSAVPLIIGLVVVVLIGGAAGAVVVRRRAGTVE